MKKFGLWIFMVCLSLIVIQLFTSPQADESAWHEQHNLVAHAMGGIDGYKYTNSKEAVENNYKQEYRVFEVDLTFTEPDPNGTDHLVARHDWTQDYGQSSFKKGRMNYQDFMSSKIYGKYTPLHIRDITRFMKLNPDMRVILDIKETDPDMELKAYRHIQTAAEQEGISMSRFIPQIYNESMLDDIQAIYPFPDLIYTLYRSPSDDEQVIKWSKDNDIDAVVMSEKRYSQKLVDELFDQNIPSYVHTINNEKKAMSYINKGVWGIYTDFIGIDGEFFY